MTARLWLLAHAITPAIRRAAFPDGEGIDPGAVDAVRQLSSLLPRAKRLLTSPARRARETAALINGVPEADTSLRDIDMGHWRGRTLDDVVAKEPEALAAWRADPLAAPHGGESISELASRVGEWLSAFGFEGRSLAVTHPAVMRVALLHVLQAPLDSFWSVDVPPLSIMELSHDGRRWAFRTGRIRNLGGDR